MNTLRNSIIAVFIALVVLGLTSLFTVYETQRALMIKLGKLLVGQDNKPVILEPGLHFKLPFVSRIIYLDTRLQTLEMESPRVVTKNKEDVVVSSYTKWRIKDFSLFYTSTKGDMTNARQQLGIRIEDAIRAEFGKRTIRNVVSGERTDIMDILQGVITQSTKSLGVDIVDVRIKRIDLPEKINQFVFEQMRTEREQAATALRASGEQRAKEIRADADKRATIILAKADRTSKTLKGEGDQLAAKIYADAYKKNPEFYAFYQSLTSYRDAFKDKEDLLVITPDSDFFKYFNNPKASG